MHRMMRSLKASSRSKERLAGRGSPQVASQPVQSLVVFPFGSTDGTGVHLPSGSVSGISAQTQAQQIRDYQGVLQYLAPKCYGIRGSYVVSNLLLNSENLKAGTWSGISNVNVTTGTLDPDGGNTAYTLTAIAAFSFFYQLPAQTIGDTFSSGWWVRRRTGTGAVNMFSGSAGTNITSQVTGEWKRIVVENGVATASTVYAGIGLSVAGDAIDVWHPMIMETTNNPTVGMPPYIPTLATPVTVCYDHLPDGTPLRPFYTLGGGIRYNVFRPTELARSMAFNIGDCIEATDVFGTRRYYRASAIVTSLGSELCADPTMDNASAWVLGSSTIVSGGEMQCVDAPLGYSNMAYIGSLSALVQGQDYLMVSDITDITKGDLNFSIGDNEPYTPSAANFTKKGLYGNIMQQFTVGDNLFRLYTSDTLVTTARCTGFSVKAITLASADAYWANTVILCHADNTGAPTTLVNAAPGAYPCTITGANITQSATGSICGPASIDYQASGTGNYISLGDLSQSYFYHDLTESWTFEFQITAPVSGGSYRGFFQNTINNGNGSPNCTMVMNPDMTVSFVIADSTGKVISINSAALTAGTKYWVAVSYDNTTGTAYFFLNGNLVGTAQKPSGWDTSVLLAPCPMTLGSYGNGTGFLCTGSKFDEIRVTRGVCRYTADYTPRTTAFPETATLLTSGTTGSLSPVFPSSGVVADGGILWEMVGLATILGLELSPVSTNHPEGVLFQFPQAGNMLTDNQIIGLDLFIDQLEVKQIFGQVGVFNLNTSQIQFIVGAQTRSGNTGKLASAFTRMLGRMNTTNAILYNDGAMFTGATGGPITAEPVSIGAASVANQITACILNFRVLTNSALNDTNAIARSRYDLKPAVALNADTNSEMSNV